MYVRDNHGIDTEESYPYEMADDDCQFNKNTIGSDSTGFVNIRKSQDEDLMKAIASVGPIAVAIDASTEYFMQYTNGIYNNPRCSPKNLDHGVLVVGYGSEDGHDFWILKNSWGTSWGEKGYFRMSRNTTNMCGISELASFPLV
jgi:cathepsin L